MYNVRKKGKRKNEDLDLVFGRETKAMATDVRKKGKNDLVIRKVGFPLFNWRLQRKDTHINVFLLGFTFAKCT